MRLLAASIVCGLVALSLQAPSGPHIKITVMTSNVGGDPPLFEEDLEEGLGVSESSSPAMLIVALQESQLLDPGDPWLKVLDRFSSSKKFHRIAYKFKDGLAIYVYANNPIAHEVKDIAFSESTKSTLRVRFTLAGKSYLVINSQLPGGEGKYAERVQAANQIWKESQPADVNIWAGDFNFRLEGSMNADAILAQIESNSESLLAKDELRKAKKQGDAFESLTEMDIQFKPSFKFVVGMDKYDTQTRPAWTDRVLYGGEIDGVSYGLVNAVTSTHKPVVAVFTARL